MSWKRYFTNATVGNNDGGNMSPFSGRGGNEPGPAKSNYSSYLPDVYVGSPNRIERYGQYNTMDNDSEVNAALDILAEFCSQQNPRNLTPFILNFNKTATNSEVNILGQYLKQWTKLQKFETKMFRVVRNTFKYGDAFFVRDPESKKWFYIDPAKVVRIIVNESEGKKPEQYIIKDINFNFRDRIITDPHITSGNITGGGTAAGSQGYQAGGAQGAVGNTGTSQAGSRFNVNNREVAIDAEHVIHLSLSEGLDNNYPFGNSLLESIFKVYKQKELLEDAIIIYRTQRAPERRVFYIDVGNMPTNKAMAFIERVKNEIHQKRIPNKTGGGANIMDAAYNPLSQIEDYFFAQTAEGRGSKVETLPGGQNLGEIDDLKYFNNKLMKGLRIPSSYLPSTPDDAGSAFTDGRVGTAYIQEFRFTKFCQRLQTMVMPTLDKEFKMFLKHRGIEIDSGSFEIQFNDPQNFGKYRQVEIDNQMVSIFTQVQQVPYISKRFAMKRFLGLDEGEIYSNEKLWAEENANATEPPAQGDDVGGGAGLSDVGAAPMPASDPGELEDDPAGDAADAGADSPLTPDTDTTPEQ